MSALGRASMHLLMTAPLAFDGARASGGCGLQNRWGRGRGGRRRYSVDALAEGENLA